MKKQIIAVAVALLGTAAFAQNTSTVTGNVISASNVVNSGSSTHTATTLSTNAGLASGAASCGVVTCAGTASASNGGTTNANVTGTGPGFAAAAAGQGGSATSIQNASIAPNALGTTGNVNLNVNAQTGTLSTALEVGSGTSSANTVAGALTNGNVAAVALLPGTSAAIGNVVGTNNVTSGGTGLFANFGTLDGVFGPGAGAGNLGAVSGTITRP